MTQVLFFLVAAALLFGGLYMLRRLWWDYARVTEADEVFEQRVASLNNDQANRVSDELLTRPLNSEEAWKAMVRRGGRSARRERPPRRPRVRRSR